MEKVLGWREKEALPGGRRDSGRIQKPTPPKSVRIHPVSSHPWKLCRKRLDGEDAGWQQSSFKFMFPLKQSELHAIFSNGLNRDSGF